MIERRGSERGVRVRDRPRETLREGDRDGIDCDFGNVYVFRFDTTPRSGPHHNFKTPI